MTRAGRILAPLVDLVLPVDCAGCAAPGIGLCPACRAELSGPAQPRGPTGWVWTAGSYAGPLSRIIPAWKDGGRLDLTAELAPALARAVRAVLAAAGPRSPGIRSPGGILLVPVPSARRAVRARGEDVVADLAHRAAGRLSGGPTGATASVSALRVTRRLVDQSGLGVAERRRNVAGAFEVGRTATRSVCHLPCVLVDDVLTTGASAAEGVRALRAAGAEVLGVATVCATPPRRRLSAPRGSD